MGCADFHWGGGEQTQEFGFETLFNGKAVFLI
jgi:hypothetical protein